MGETNQHFFGQMALSSQTFKKRPLEFFFFCIDLSHFCSNHWKVITSSSNDDEKIEHKLAWSSVIFHDFYQKKNVPGRSNNKKKIDQKVADDKNDFTEVQGFFMLISHYKKCMKVDK